MAMCAFISSKGGCGATLCLGAKLPSCTTMASSSSCGKFVADMQPHQSPAHLCSMRIPSFQSLFLKAGQSQVQLEREKGGHVLGRI